MRGQQQPGGQKAYDPYFTVIFLLSLCSLIALCHVGQQWQPQPHTQASSANATTSICDGTTFEEATQRGHALEAAPKRRICSLQNAGSQFIFLGRFIFQQTLARERRLYHHQQTTKKETESRLGDDSTHAHRKKANFHHWTQKVCHHHLGLISLSRLQHRLWPRNWRARVILPKKRLYNCFVHSKRIRR